MGFTTEEYAIHYLKFKDMFVTLHEAILNISITSWIASRIYLLFRFTLNFF